MLRNSWWFEQWGPGEWGLLCCHHWFQFQGYRTLFNKNAQGQGPELVGVMARCRLQKRPQWCYFFGRAALMKLFTKYNTPIPSSAAVERLFSIGKEILRARRCQLSDDMFERLMFMKSNLHHMVSKKWIFWSFFWASSGMFFDIF